MKRILTLLIFYFSIQIMSASAKPNVIVIFADDMGYGDMSNNGHPSIRTPNLDKMAMEGQKWTNFYAAAPVCTPSRAGLMTGLLPIRNGMSSNKTPVLFPDSSGGLPPKEFTLAELFKSKGYQTGMVGKWHLGHLNKYLPINQGFDSWFGIPYSNDMNPNVEKIKSANNGKDTVYMEGNHWSNPKSEYFEVPLMLNDKIVEYAPDQEQLTKSYTKKSIEFIKVNKDKPFFLYLAYSMPHVPLFRSDDFKEHSPAGLYGDVIEELDWSVGEIFKVLKNEGVADNTLVVFTSDNGPWKIFKTLGGIAGPLKDGKGTTWEGGMREPAIFWGPGQIKPGIVHELGSTIDLMSTFSTLINADLPGTSLDGYDLSSILISGPAVGKLRIGPRKEVFYYKGTNLNAIRLGSYKAHYKTGKLTHKIPLLFNLDEDAGEAYNIAGQYPDILKEIELIRQEHLASVASVENQLETRKAH